MRSPRRKWACPPLRTGFETNARSIVVPGRWSECAGLCIAMRVLRSILAVVAGCFAAGDEICPRALLVCEGLWDVISPPPPGVDLSDHAAMAKIMDQLSAGSFTHRCWRAGPSAIGGAERRGTCAAWPEACRCDDSNFGTLNRRTGDDGHWRSRAMLTIPHPVWFELCRGAALTPASAPGLARKIGQGCRCQESPLWRPKRSKLRGEILGRYCLRRPPGTRSQFRLHSSSISCQTTRTKSCRPLFSPPVPIRC